MIDHSKAKNKWTCWAISLPSSQCAFVHPVVGEMPSAYDGWTFLCCDRQNDPSGLPGLQLKAEQEHSLVGMGCLVHEQMLSIPTQVEWGPWEQVPRWGKKSVN